MRISATRIAQAVLFAVLAFLALPVLAVASEGELLVSDDQLWVIAVGSIVPLGGYVLARFTPSQPVSAFIHVLLAAIAGGFTQAITAGSVGFNDTTFQFVLTSIAAALAAHGFLWKPAQINEKLNRP